MIGEIPGTEICFIWGFGAVYNFQLPVFIVNGDHIHSEDTLSISEDGDLFYGLNYSARAIEKGIENPKL